MKAPPLTGPTSAISGELRADRDALPLEAATRAIGEELFGLVEEFPAPSLFSRQGFQGRLMDWAMRDAQFKTQLFRFVDVLPSLGPADITRHLREYLLDAAVHLPPSLRTALQASGLAGGLVGGGLRAQITDLARQFMLGNDPRAIVATLRALHQRGVAFTVDILGETVVSEPEADRCARRYLELLDLLAHETTQWSAPCRSNLTPTGDVPAVNLSLKISALYSQIHPADPDTAIGQLAARVRPILKRAQERGACVTFDMEHYALKNLTLRLFQTVFAESEFVKGPACGLALQAYLRDSQADLRQVVRWAEEHERPITIRLVKGAYWDYETVVARQRGWPTPVFTRKAETDANYERLTRYLLEHHALVTAAFGTHNIRSIAHALAVADDLGLSRRDGEFQVLHGMADALAAALVRLELRVREYCPVGELLPGMAYLVRRLLENTSNEGFLASKFAHGVDHTTLLQNPAEVFASEKSACPVPPHPSPADVHGGGAGAGLSLSGERQEVAANVPASPLRGRGRPRVVSGPGEGAGLFRNEPVADFTLPAARDRVRTALHELRAHLGQRHPLVINNQAVTTGEWRPSLNPANQREVVGYAARATIDHAAAALAAARAAQPAWGRRPATERADILERLADQLRADRAALTALEILEAGKNWTEADADVAEAIDFCVFYATVARQLGTPQRTQVVPGEANCQQWWPRGVGVVIAPWNFPLAILTGMSAAAAVTGNAVIMKPSDQTPVLAARLMALCVAAGFPPGVINLLTGPGAEIGGHLVAHPHIDFIAFTGSLEVGRQIWETAGRTPAGQTHLKKVVCEMGGKNALIIDSDADLDEAITGTLVSAFGYQGQKCSALSRLIVVADQAGQFLERLVAATASLRVGPAEEPGTVIGPVIDRAAQQRLLAAIEAGRREAKLAWQGWVPADPHACYVPPTIFTDVAPASRLFREELFGPVLAVTTANDFGEALALANDSEFALTGGVYSRSPSHLDRARAEFVCGNLYLNRPITGAIVGRQPFGGFRLSGGGTKAGGVEYLQQFMVPRVVTENCLRRGFAPEE